MEKGLYSMLTSMSAGGSQISRRKFTRKGAKPKTSFKIPSSALAFGVVIFCIFILSGGVYNILDHPPSVIPYGNSYLTLNPYTSDQTVYESVFVFFTYSAAFLGLWLAYRSTQVMYDKSKANQYLLFGIAFSLLGVAGLYLILDMKSAILG
jgi:hypothetical protein